MVLNNVYQWNPKTDTLEETGVPSVLKQKLARIQGITQKEVDTEIYKRKRVLDYMVKNNITRIDEVGKVFSRYYSDTDDLIKEVDEVLNG